MGLLLGGRNCQFEEGRAVRDGFLEKILCAYVCAAREWALDCTVWDRTRAALAVVGSWAL